MDEMLRKANGELRPENRELYFRLHGVKQTLEWVYPSLIKTPLRQKTGESRCSVTSITCTDRSIPLLIL